MFQLALRNIRRHTARSIMTLSAIGFGVAGLILAGGFVEDVLVQLGEGTIHSHSGHLQIFVRGYDEHGRRNPESYLLSGSGQIRERIAAQPEIKDVLLRLGFSGLLSNGRTDVPVVGEGVEAAREVELGTSLSITAGRQLTEADHYGLLLGEGVAAVSGLKPGQRASLLLSTPDGALNALDFEVVGVFRSFSKDYDAHAVRLPLAAAQELLNSRGVTSVVVSLHRTEDTDRVALALAAQLGDQPVEIRTWRQLNDFYEKAVEMYRQQLGVLQFIMLIMVLLSVVNTINMMVFERIGEFGTLRALGNRRSEVFRLVLAEALILGVGGAMFGLLLGVLLSVVLSALGLAMPPLPGTNVGYTASVRLVPSVLALASFVGMAATVLAGVLPALRAARTPIAVALRENH
ncbi:MAG: FtsX-like permease family protein [Accumulibacter sp.]|jgi:putative ABC transport system permease protein